MYFRTYTLVFVVEKLRRGTGFGDRLEAVTTHKQASIHSLVELYLLDRQPDFDTVSFDVVEILLGKGPPSVRHIEDAF